MKCIEWIEWERMVGMSIYHGISLKLLLTETLIYECKWQFYKCKYFESFFFVCLLESVFVVKNGIFGMSEQFFVVVLVVAHLEIFFLLSFKIDCVEIACAREWRTTDVIFWTTNIATIIPKPFAHTAVIHNFRVTYDKADSSR